MNWNEIIDELTPQLIKSLQECIHIRSVLEEDNSGYPYGQGVQNCLSYALDEAKGLGFETKSLDNRLGWCEWGTGKEMVVVLGHLDVVPEGDGWTYPPYEAVIANGRLYGRGAIDDKGPVMAALYALYALKKSGFKPSRRIRLIFGLNEESGSSDMKYYAAAGQEMPVFGFTPDGEYPVINGEKGLVNVGYTAHFGPTAGPCVVSVHGGTAHNIVPAFAEAELSCGEQEAREILARPECTGICRTRTAAGVHIEAAGKGAHGGSPKEGINAVGRLLLELAELPLEDQQSRAIRFLARSIGMEYDGASLGIAQSDALSGPLTLNLGTIDGDAAHLEVKLNCRYPVTGQFESCGPQIKRQFADAGFEETWFSHKKSLYMPPESELIQKLTRVYHECTGLPAEPKCIGGGTYAKMMPNTVAFGPVFPGDEVREHKPDEFIELSRLTENTKLIAAAMYELAK